MAGLRIQNQRRKTVTVVDNLFLDHYMAEANGEFVKVYLCLLRYQEERELTVSGLADVLNNTEADIIRALRYWEKAGLLKLQTEETGALSGVTLLWPEEERLPETAATAQGGNPSGEARKEAEEGAKKAASPSRKGTPEPEKAPSHTLADFQNDTAFSQLLFLAETYRKQPLSRKDTDIFVNLYGNLGMSAELLEYLVESCVEAGHSSMAYMEKVALNWHQAGITTPEEAKERNTVYKKEYFSVLRALGISGRNPVKAELAYLDRWFGEYGFTLELVEEACGRTMKAIQKPSFPYVEKILRGWKEKGIRCKGDIERLDKKPERAGEKNLQEGTAGRTGGTNRNGSAAGNRARTTNRFHNFQEHDYDYDALMKQAIKMNREK